jgi:transcriptional regulator with XRE-family HTH domain
VPSELGEFLQSSRRRISPQDVGLPPGVRRRVPGLRREEVASLADVSVDYYMRLEQGRETSPSPQVTEALGRALRLDDQARLHLFRLAGLAPRLLEPTDERVAPSLVALLDDWSEHPAIVLGRAFDVLAANDLAERLFEGFAPSRNLIESLFLDPGAPRRYPQWREVAEWTVAGFRILHGSEPGDPRLAEVLEHLAAGSDDFRAMWEDPVARGRRLEQKTIRHHEVGAVTLAVHAFDVRAAPGQELVVYRAEPGSESAAALARL